MNLLALDPSLASTGWAVFPTKGIRPESMFEALRLFDVSGTIKTGKRTKAGVEVSIFHRLAVLDAALCEVLGAHDIDRIAIERSPLAGAYSRHSETTIRMYQHAVGAVTLRAVLHAGAEGVSAVPTENRKKIKRHEYLDALAAEVGVELPHGLRGARQQDEYDAIFVGMSFLRSGVA